MAFNIEQLQNFALKKILEFSRDNKSGIFYGCAIDASAIYMNSIQNYEETLAGQTAEFPGVYDNEEEKMSLKENVGDWIQVADFRDLTKQDVAGTYTGPFDEDLYDEHYNQSDDEQETSEYAKAMNLVIKFLSENNAFETFNRTKDFKVSRVEHTY